LAGRKSVAKLRKKVTVVFQETCGKKKKVEQGTAGLSRPKQDNRKKGSPPSKIGNSGGGTKKEKEEHGKATEAEVTERSKKEGSFYPPQRGITFSKRVDKHRLISRIKNTKKKKKGIKREETVTTKSVRHYL